MKTILELNGTIQIARFPDVFYPAKVSTVTSPGTADSTIRHRSWRKHAGRSTLLETNSSFIFVFPRRLTKS